MADANGFPSLNTQDLMPSPSDSPEAAEVNGYMALGCSMQLADRLQMLMMQHVMGICMAGSTDTNTSLSALT